jgi:hypothetical protein
MFCGLAEVLSPQKSLGQQSSNPQITNPQITRDDWVSKLEGLKSPKICGFAICETNLRTAHLCPLVQIFWQPVCPVACGVKLAAATLEIAVDGGGVGRVLDMVPHLVVVRQQDEVGVPLSHHSSLQPTELLYWIEFQKLQATATVGKKISLFCGAPLTTLSSVRGRQCFIYTLRSELVKDSQRKYHGIF